MEHLIEVILLLKPYEIQNIINVMIALLVIGAYFIPLLFVLNDIADRYKSRIMQVFLSALAIVFLPIFLIIYILFRKEATVLDENEIQREYAINLVGNSAMECPSCRTVTHRKSNFCQNCGTCLVYKCQHCNFLIERQWRYCVKCGTSQQPDPNLENKLRGKKLLSVIGYKINHLTFLFPTVNK